MLTCQTTRIHRIYEFFLRIHTNTTQANQLNWNCHWKCNEFCGFNHIRCIHTNKQHYTDIEINKVNFHSNLSLLLQEFMFAEIRMNVFF